MPRIRKIAKNIDELLDSFVNNWNYATELGSNMSHRERAFYSYNTIISKIISTEDTCVSCIVMEYDRGWSNATHKHIYHLKTLETKFDFIELSSLDVTRQVIIDTINWSIKKINSKVIEILKCKNYNGFFNKLRSIKSIQENLQLITKHFPIMERNAINHMIDFYHQIKMPSYNANDLEMLILIGDVVNLELAQKFRETHKKFLDLADKARIEALIAKKVEYSKTLPDTDL
jgi:hypothetical protein